MLKQAILLAALILLSVVIYIFATQYQPVCEPQSKFDHWTGKSPGFSIPVTNRNR